MACHRIGIMREPRSASGLEMNLTKLAVCLSRMTPRKTHIVLPLLLMIALYWLSSIPGTPMPDEAAVHRLFLWIPPSVQNLLHVPTYAGLTLAWHWALQAWLRSRIMGAASAGMIASLFGLFDEWHQSFVPGRYASLTDLVFNLVGVATGLWFAIRIGPQTGNFPSTEAKGPGAFPPD